MGWSKKGQEGKGYVNPGKNRKDKDGIVQNRTGRKGICESRKEQEGQGRDSPE